MNDYDHWSEPFVQKWIWWSLMVLMMIIIVMMMKKVVVKMFKIDLLALTALTSLRWHCFAFKSWISHQNLSRFGFPTRICQYLDFLLEFVKIWISYQNLSRLATHLMTQATFELLVQCRNDLLTKVYSGNMLGRYLQDMMITMMM